MPAWGAATVVAGDPALAPVGARYAGYLPMATHVLMRAEAGPAVLQDVSEERAGMLPMYRELHRVDTDATWREDLLDAEVLMLPVYPPAALLDDDLRRAGTRHVVISSASSKTSLAIGRLLRDRGVLVTGLSGKARTQAASSSGAVDQVLSYEDLADLPVREDTTFVDVAGDPAVVRAVHERLGAALSHSIAVGGSHLPSLDGLPSPDPTRPGRRPVQRRSARGRAQGAARPGRGRPDRAAGAADPRALGGQDAGGAARRGAPGGAGRLDPDRSRQPRRARRRHRHSVTRTPT